VTELIRIRFLYQARIQEYFSRGARCLVTTAPNGWGPGARIRDPGGGSGSEAP